jgi:hypothetical protein
MAKQRDIRKTAPPIRPLVQKDKCEESQINHTRNEYLRGEKMNKEELAGLKRSIKSWIDDYNKTEEHDNDFTIAMKDDAYNLLVDCLKALK